MKIVMPPKKAMGILVSDKIDKDRDGCIICL
jgi:hypothetical protein